MTIMMCIGGSGCFRCDSRGESSCEFFDKSAFGCNHPNGPLSNIVVTPQGALMQTIDRAERPPAAISISDRVCLDRLQTEIVCLERWDLNQDNGLVPDSDGRYLLAREVEELIAIHKGEPQTLPELSKRYADKKLREDYYGTIPLSTMHEMELPSGQKVEFREMSQADEIALCHNPECRFNPSSGVAQICDKCRESLIGYFAEGEDGEIDSIRLERLAKWMGIASRGLDMQSLEVLRKQSKEETRAKVVGEFGYLNEEPSHKGRMYVPDRMKEAVERIRNTLANQPGPVFGFVAGQEVDPEKIRSLETVFGKQHEDPVVRPCRSKTVMVMEYDSVTRGGMSLAISHLSVLDNRNFVWVCEDDLCRDECEWCRALRDRVKSWNRRYESMAGQDVDEEKLRSLPGVFEKQLPNKEGAMTEKDDMLKNIDEAIEIQKKRIAMAVKNEVGNGKLDNSTGAEIDLLTSLVANKMELLARIAGSPVNPLANDQTKGLLAIAKALEEVAAAIRDKK